MQPIQAILFEPVGCLAEFPSEPFHEIATRIFGVPKKKPSRSGSRAYWHLLNLMEGSQVGSKAESIEALEMEAVDSAAVYEDVLPALSELRAMGTRMYLASSLSRAAIRRFLVKCSLDPLFAGVWSRDDAGGIKAAPLRCAVAAAAARPEQTMFLTDTAEGLRTAKSVGIHPILMMNDPDEARRLTAYDPSGGIVSLHELPDFVRLLRTAVVI
jgi:beta-phosphoglucomutase-like phosphatase (HAD superfamily)